MKTKVGLQGEGCRWYKVRVEFAGMGQILPGKACEPVYAKKWVIRVQGQHVTMVMSVSLGKNKHIEIFHENIAKVCLIVGGVAKNQQMVTRVFRQIQGDKK